jgi:hypothetical protein
LLSVLLVCVGAAAFIFNLSSPGQAAIEADAKTAAALAMAKDGLIAYAASVDTAASDGTLLNTARPGELPCPDRSLNNGVADTNCHLNIGRRIGRLPWKTLGLPDLRDGSGERLWYAVSAGFIESARSSTAVLNSNTGGEYTVTGVSAASNVIAVVFAPGAALGTQNRDSSVSALCSTTGLTVTNNFCATNYLESENSNGDTTLDTQLPSTTFNDRAMLITQDNFFPTVSMRVAREARIFLNAYYTLNGLYPNANPYTDNTYYCSSTTYQGRIPQTINSGGLGCTAPVQPAWGAVAIPNWFFLHEWHKLVFYAVSTNCARNDFFSSLLCVLSGGLTVTGVSTNARALVITTGRAYTGQTRPCAAVADCLDDADNTNGDTVFTKPTISPTNNDRMVIVAP